MSRYVSKEARGEANGLREVLQAVPGRRVFRASTKLTKVTRVTMRNLRLRRSEYMRTGASLSPLVAEWLWLDRRRYAEARQLELTTVRLLELRFCEGPAPPPGGWPARTWITPQLPGLLPS
jgi:hypothetical protein